MMQRDLGHHEKQHEGGSHHTVKGDDEQVSVHVNAAPRKRGVLTLKLPYGKHKDCPERAAFPVFETP
jgi:hypothetical protein